MTDRSTPSRSTSFLASSSASASRMRTTESSSVRPRNRRLISTDEYSSSASQDLGSGLLSTGGVQPGSGTTSRSVSNVNTGNIGQFLEESWTQSWNSVQGFASSLLVGGDKLGRKRTFTGKPQPLGSAAPRRVAWERQASADNRANAGDSWGPSPPLDPDLNDVAAGSLAERESALKAAKKASLLQSHDGVNGGLDISGKHKRRNSDDIAVDDPLQDDYLVYIHTVQPSDTYAGLILRYRCREDAFRRANGLWSRDSLQTRKWLVIPVDTCEIRGRPCDPPSWANSNKVDLLAPTPAAVEEDRDQSAATHDFFSHTGSGEPSTTNQDQVSDGDGKPWTHVKWVRVETMPEPIEIGRVARQTMGYFPPRRRKSMRTMSSFSTPRHSVDLSNGPAGSIEGSFSRRQSSLGSRPQLLGTPTASRSRGGSEAGDARPAWMRRPGGVGSMSRSVRAPGPDNDYFNTWAKKHIPGLNVDDLPSMSVMGSESAHFGFDRDAPGIVESPYEEGRNTNSTTRQGTGLDKAAAAVETWLRGALAKRPGTPLMVGRSRAVGAYGADPDGDLIELTDTGSEDGRLMREASLNMLDSLSLGTSSRTEGEGAIRGRHVSLTAKGQKAE